MIDRQIKAVFFPKDWANEIVAWIAGIHSPSGMVRIKNTRLPDSSGSLALDIDLDELAEAVADELLRIYGDELYKMLGIVPELPASGSGEGTWSNADGTEGGSFSPIIADGGDSGDGDGGGGDGGEGGGSSDGTDFFGGGERPNCPCRLCCGGNYCNSCINYGSCCGYLLYEHCCRHCGDLGGTMGPDGNPVPSDDAGRGGSSRLPEEEEDEEDENRPHDAGTGDGYPPWWDDEEESDTSIHVSGGGISNYVPQPEEGTSGVHVVSGGGGNVAPYDPEAESVGNGHNFWGFLSSQSGKYTVWLYFYDGHGGRWYQKEKEIDKGALLSDLIHGWAAVVDMKTGEKIGSNTHLNGDVSLLFFMNLEDYKKWRNENPNPNAEGNAASGNASPTTWLTIWNDITGEKLYLTGVSPNAKIMDCIPWAIEDGCDVYYMGGDRVGNDDLVGDGAWVIYMRED